MAEDQGLRPLSPLPAELDPRLPAPRVNEPFGDAEPFPQEGRAQASADGPNVEGRVHEPALQLVEREGKLKEARVDHGAKDGAIVGARLRRGR